MEVKLDEKAGAAIIHVRDDRQVYSGKLPPFQLYDRIAEHIRALMGTPRDTQSLVSQQATPPPAPPPPPAQSVPKRAAKAPVPSKIPVSAPPSAAPPTPEAPPPIPAPPVATQTSLPPMPAIEEQAPNQTPGRRCPKCGEVILQERSFCPECNSKLPYGQGW